ncbi:class I SAM-dependent methyltransferase [Roseivivax sp.]
MTKVDTTYESYAQDNHYVSVNRQLVSEVDLGAVSRVADLACGTGLLSRMLLERKPGLAVCGIDLDPVQIELSRRGLEEDGARFHDSLEAWRAAAEAGQGGVHLRVDSAMELPFADGEIDLVVIGNAIHMMPDRPAFLAEVARVLRPGGQFVFNSVFYAGTFVEGTEMVFTEMMKEAVLAMNELNAERKTRGEPPVPRKRGTVKRAFQQTEWVSEAGWAEAVEAHGLRVTMSRQTPVAISQRGLELVGGYGGLAEVLMSGYPVDIASECMQAGVARAFANLEISEVPRNWLEVTAKKAG